MERGFYHRQLEWYLQYFSREQILILLYEDIAAEPYPFIQKIYWFLGVDSSFRPSVALKRVNVGELSPRFHSLYRLGKLLAGYFHRAGMGHLAWALSRSKFATLFQPLYARTAVQPPLAEAKRAELRELFAPDVRALEKLVKRDLRRIWFD